MEEKEGRSQPLILDAVRTTLADCPLSRAVVLPYHTMTEKAKTTGPRHSKPLKLPQKVQLLVGLVDYVAVSLQSVAYGGAKELFKLKKGQKRLPLQ